MFPEGFIGPAAEVHGHDECVADSHSGKACFHGQGGDQGERESLLELYVGSSHELALADGSVAERGLNIRRAGERIDQGAQPGATVRQRDESDNFRRSMTTTYAETPLYPQVSLFLQPLLG